MLRLTFFFNLDWVSKTSLRRLRKQEKKSPLDFQLGMVPGFVTVLISPWVTLVPSKCQTFPFWMPEEKLLFNNGTLKVMRKPYNCVQLNITHNSLGFHSRACPIWVCKKDGEGMLKHIFLDPSSGAFCSLVLVWGLWFCISNKLLSDSEAVGPRTTFCVVLV